jgi:hypothetical protein
MYLKETVNLIKKTMSLELIEIIIKESLRDGEISDAERATIFKKGEVFGISKEIVNSLINAEVEKLSYKKLEEQRKQKEEEQRLENERVKRERDLQKSIDEEFLAKRNLEVQNNFNDWKDNFDEVNFLTWGLLYGGIGLILGVLNAYTHNKEWLSYIGMPILCLIYGYLVYAASIGISFLTKRKPLLDWHKPILIAFIVMVLFMIIYFLIPF